MKKFIITLFTILIVGILIVLILINRFSEENIFNAIEKQTGLKIELIDKSLWAFYPTITYNNSNITITKDLGNLTKLLKKTYMKLRSIEDEKRMCEKNKDFGKKFIELARSVYLNNDKRAKIKSGINKLLGSNIREIKKYINY